MKKLLTLLSLTALCCAVSKADVEKQGVIDAIATRPDSDKALLLLQQQKPWTDVLVELAKTKLDFYVAAVTTGSLVEQRPALKGKKIRIIVLYAKSPPNALIGQFEIKKAELEPKGISLVWGQDIAVLAAQP